MASPTGFAATQDAIAKSLVAVTRSTNALCAEDLPFHRSFDRTVARLVDEQNARLFQLSQRLLAAAGLGSDGPAAFASGGGPLLPDTDAVDAQWRDIVDVVDSLLERADTSLDEYGGYVRRAVAEDASSGQQGGTPGKTNWNNLSTKHALAKPQKAFEVPPQNFATQPFKPFLTTKPHAKVSLEESLEEQKAANGRIFYPHPYETEIKEYIYPSSLRVAAEPTPYQPWESTTATLVDTPEALEEMLAELKQATEIAIDLEHHDTRSYIGIVSLMQISTRNRDWIVDTLKPWRRRLQCLNEVFANPNILKVLHGAHMDAIWLQRDLGLYLVGLFDTFHAAEALQYPQKSLAALLKKHVDFNAQKQYQTADWRQRPLPSELFEYARADTHFLLYVFDCLRNELAELSAAQDVDLVHYVQESSKQVALQRYEHSMYDPVNGLGVGGWYNYLVRKGGAMSKEQFAVFKAVHTWRDQVARQEDDSSEFTLKAHTLMEIARTVPTDAPTLLSLLPPNNSTARSRLQDLLAVVVKAKADGAAGPEMYDELDRIYNLDESVTGIKRFKKPHKQESPPAAIQPSAAPAQQTSMMQGMAAPKRPTIDSAAATRAEGSGFWGSITNFFTGQRRPFSTDVRLTLPMPDLASAEPMEGVPVMPFTTPAVPAHDAAEQPSPSARDDVFIIRQLGGPKRKRTAAEAGLDHSSVAQITTSTTETTSTSAADEEEDSSDSDSESSNSEDGEISSPAPDMDAEHPSPSSLEDATPSFLSVSLPDQSLGPKSLRETAHANVDKASTQSGKTAKKLRKKARREAKKEAQQSRKVAREEQKQMRKQGVQGEKKEKKKRNKGGKKDKAQTEQKQEPEAEFNYSTAPSVLHAAAIEQQQARQQARQQGGKAAKKKGKNKVEGFNPYKRAMDAPKGLPKVQRAGAGRSATFKEGT